MSDKLTDSDLPLLFDEEIYVIDTTFDSKIKKQASTEVSADDADPPKLDYKGDFGKEVLILFSDKDVVELTAGDEEFLLKVLAAVDLGLEDVAILNVSQGQAWEDFLSPTHVLSFGVPELAAGYQITAHDESAHLYCDSLSVIAENVELKKKLWAGLKSLFAL